MAVEEIGIEFPPGPVRTETIAHRPDHVCISVIDNVPIIDTAPAIETKKWPYSERWPYSYPGDLLSLKGMQTTQWNRGYRLPLNTTFPVYTFQFDIR